MSAIIYPMAAGRINSLNIKRSGLEKNCKKLRPGLTLYIFCLYMNTQPVISLPTCLGAATRIVLKKRLPSSVILWRLVENAQTKSPAQKWMAWMPGFLVICVVKMAEWW